MGSRKRAPNGVAAGDEWDDADVRRRLADLRVRREVLAAECAAVAARRFDARLDRLDEELLDLGPLPYFIVDRSGNVRRANDAGARLLGLEKHRLTNTPLLVFVVEDDWRKFLDHMRRSRDSSSVVTTELVMRSRDEVEIPVEMSTRAYRQRTDAAAMYHTMVVDLRSRLRTEAELRRAIADRARMEEEQAAIRATAEAKDRFLAMLSHELRTPLSPVVAAAAAWKDDPALPAEAREAFAMVHRNATVEARLIDDLLDLTRITENKLLLRWETVDLRRVVDEVLRSLQPEIAKAGIVVARETGPDCAVRGDFVRLSQVLWNLVGNAVRFCSRGSRIEIAIGNPRPGVTALAVSDDGSGFEPQLSERLFEPFQQASRSSAQGGLGLGLAIAKGIVEAHGGTISAHSAGVGRGALFAIELPSAAQPPAAADAPLATTAATPHGPLTILLVEDHRDTALALSFVLEHGGYAVKCAYSVAEALATDVSTIDLVVSDLGLPDGSGLDVMRTLKARKPLRGIALTGYGRREDIVDTRAAGFDRHLTKPVDPPELVAAIESLRFDAA